MNSSLPNLPASTVPVTAAAPLNAAALADLGSLAGPTMALPGEFADLLSATPPAPLSSVPPGVPTAAPAGLVLPSVVPVPAAACPTVVTAPMTSAAWVVPASPAAQAGQPVVAAAAAPADATPAEALETVAPAAGPEATPAAATKPAISRDTLEQAASFVASFLQALWPELTAAPAATTTATPPSPGPAAGLPAMAARAESANGSVVAAKPAAPARPEVAAPVAPSLADAAAPASRTAEASSFAVALAADGAIEIKLTAPSGATETSPATNASSAPIELHAEVEIPGRAVLRLEATGDQPQDFAGFTAGAKFAGKKPALRATLAAGTDAAERNFVFTGAKRVKAASPEAGIAVAQKAPIMSAAPIEETRPTRLTDFPSAAAVRADFQGVPPPAERITAPATAPAGQNFAERAVATVTGLVDAQFSASMQRAGSVNLRLKFGGEDLSVRVELRGGAVHTDFQTDSPELRAALTREWQALTNAAPAEIRRYLDPVFSPAAPSTATGDGHSQSSGRQAQSQQQAAQQDLPQRQAREFAEIPTPFSRRSSLNESFSPASLEPRAPAFLPTSLRLSALA